MDNTPSPYFIERNGPPQGGVIDVTDFQDIEEREPALREYWIVVRRYRWLILACVVAVVLVMTLYTFTRTPLYTAQASLLLERKPQQVLKIQDSLSESIESAEYYKTQYEILKSRALAARVIRDQALESKAPFKGYTEGHDAGFFSGLFRVFADWSARPSRPAQKTEENVADVKPGTIDAYLDMVKIQPVTGTGLVRVAFSTPDALLSTRLANTHSTAYIRYGLDLRSKSNDDALTFLDKKLLDLKDRLEKSEAALNTYRRDKGIISLSDKENIVVDRLADLNRRLTEAEAERISQEANVRAIRAGNAEALPAGVTSPVAQSIKTDITRLENEYAQLAKEFKPGYPALDKVTAQLESSRRRLKSELQNSVRSVETTFQAAKTKEAELRLSMAEQKRVTLGLKDSAVEYTILDREVSTNRALYDTVLQRKREMSVAAEIQNANMYVVDRAELPRWPSYPNKTRALLLSLLLGLAAGIGLAFLLEHWNSTFRSASELERYVRLPHLGVVPDFLSLKGAGHGYLSYGYAAKLLGNGKADDGKSREKTNNAVLITEHQPLSVVTEAYRALRSALMLARAGEPARSVLFTSATRGEGKTTNLLNTAIVFAQTGGRVLVVDGDLRRPRCHKAFNFENTVGLAEVLAGQVAPLAVARQTKVPNLSMITSGAIPPNPAELLASQKMSDVLKDLEQHYDYIFIDSSPVLPVTDAVHVATMVNGVLLVVDGQNTPRQVVKRARVKLTHPRIKILGVVLNRVDVQEGAYGDYYGNYYHDYSPDEQARDSI